MYLFAWSHGSNCISVVPRRGISVYYQHPHTPCPSIEICIDNLSLYVAVEERCLTAFKFLQNMSDRDLFHLGYEVRLRRCRTQLPPLPSATERLFKSTVP